MGAEFQAVNGQRNGAIPEAFKANVDYVKANSGKDGVTLSHTGPFAAMTNEEYKKTMLGFKKPAHTDMPKMGSHELSGKAAPASIDWTTKGAVTPAPTPPAPTPTPGDHHHYGAPPCMDDEVEGNLEG